MFNQQFETDIQKWSVASPANANAATQMDSHESRANFAARAEFARMQPPIDEDWAGDCLFDCYNQ